MASASAPMVSMIRFTHSSCSTFRGSMPPATAPIKQMMSAAQFTVSCRLGSGGRGGGGEVEGFGGVWGQGRVGLNAARHRSDEADDERGAVRGQLRIGIRGGQGRVI